MEGTYCEQSFPNALHGAWLERGRGVLGRRRMAASEALTSLPFALPFGAHADLWGDRRRHSG